MSRARQGCLALAVALGAHVAAFAALPTPGIQSATGAAGEGGTSLISLAAAPANMAEMIEAWETPPEAPPDALAKPVAPTDLVAEDAPQVPVTPDMPALMSAGVVALPEADHAPTADTPPQKPETKAEAPVPKPKVEKVKKPKADQPQPKDLAAPAQKAKGNGQGATAGEGGKQDAGTLSVGRLKSRTSDWGAKIAARIERAKRYPTKASGAKGRVVLGLSVAPTGQLRSVRVKKSSGNAVLDNAAIATVKQAAPFAKAPEGVPETSMTVTLRFDAP